MSRVIRIALFEVPPEADGRFLEAWERARDGVTATTLHRALREDVAFRFVDVARVDPAESAGREIAFPSRPALYEIAHEDGAPDGSEGVVLIDAFEVPPAADEPFLAGWTAARELLAAQPGYLGTRLHRSRGPADFRFVNVARWSSPLAFARATGRPDLKAIAETLPFASHPALYLVIRQ